MCGVWKTPHLNASLGAKGWQGSIINHPSASSCSLWLIDINYRSARTGTITPTQCGTAGTLWLFVRKSNYPSQTFNLSAMLTENLFYFSSNETLKKKKKSNIWLFIFVPCAQDVKDEGEQKPQAETCKVVNEWMNEWKKANMNAWGKGRMPHGWMNDWSHEEWRRVNEWMNERIS